MPPKAKMTFTRKELDENLARLTELPRFKDAYSAEDAVREYAPTILQFLEQGFTINDIAEGISEIGMMSSATFKKYWTSLKLVGKMTTHKKDKTTQRPTDKTTQETAPSSSTETTPQPAVVKPAAAPKKPGMLVPDDGKFD